MKLKKVFALMGVFLASASLVTACGKKDEAESGTTEIRLSWWGGDSRNKAIQEAVKLFEKKNPDIKVKMEFSGYDGYQEKMTTQLSGGTAADVIRLDSMWMDQYQGQLLDLNEVKDEVGVDNFSKEVLVPVSIDDKLLGLPLSTNYRPLYYNKTMLDKYGIEVPQSWDDLIAMKDKVPEGTYPVWLNFGPKILSPVTFFQIIAQQTGEPIADENNKLIATEEDFKNGLQFYHELVQKGITPSKKYIDNAGFVDGAPAPGLADGTWLCFLDYGANITNTANSMKEQGYEIGVAGFPSMENEKSTGVWTKPAMVYSIPKTTKHKKEAAKLMNFLLNDEEAIKIQKMENGVPDSKVARETLEKADLITPLVADSQKLGDEKVDNNLSLMFRWDRARLNDMTLNLITKLDYGEVTVDEAAKEMYKAFKEEESTFGK